MFEELKKNLNEIVAIANKCPEQYREKCFSILLEHFLTSQEKPKIPKGESSKLEDVSMPQASDEFSKFIGDDSELKEAVPNVFHIEKDNYRIIIGDLKTKKKAEGQVRAALLIGIKHLIADGEASIPYEELKGFCGDHAVLDKANFQSIMKKKKKKNLFLPQDKDWKLTNPGKKEAVKLIKDLGGASE